MQLKRIQLIGLSFVLYPLCPLQAQWTPLASGLQSIRSMTNMGTDLYAATYPTGVKKSTNGGTIWDPVNTGLPTSGSTIYCESVGNNGTYVFAGTQSGIYRSNTGGSNWEIANGMLTASSTVYANKWFVFDGVTMAVFSATIANGGGIWRTTNNGDDWFIGHSGMGSNMRVNHLTKVGSTLWASTSVGLYTSADNGLNWAPFAAVNYATYSLTEIGGHLVILSTFGYRYSTNGGSSWNDATGDPASPTSGELAAYDNILYAKTGQGAGTGCVRSLDNGITWSPWNTGLGGADQISLEEFLVTSNRIYLTALFDIYYISGIGLGIGTVVKAGATLHPSPFSDRFSVEFGTTVEGELLLIDARGAIVLRRRVMGSTTNVDRGALASGTYRCCFVPTVSGIMQDLGAVIAR